MSFSVQKTQNYWSGNAVFVDPHPHVVSFTPFFFVGPDRSFVCGNNEPVGARIHILFALNEFLLSNKKPLSFTKAVLVKWFYSVLNKPGSDWILSGAVRTAVSFLAGLNFCPPMVAVFTLPPDLPV